ncbi:MAG: ABC transporter ATP-binding protein, partial [Clostridia bacterium]|nr:ABC transporter ATP-binding protein [Clostridia bacterium]
MAEIENKDLQLNNTDEDILIEMKNVSMNYKITKDKIDSIKEYFIRLVKGKIKYSQRVVLQDVSLSVKRGESLGILGKNGAGKSTILKIMSGILPPTSGEVLVKGTLIPMLNISGCFDPNATGKENIYLNGAIYGHSRKEMDKVYDDIVKFADIEEHINERVKTYSSGQRSRLAFAIAVHNKPDIILVDEVLSVGDADFQAKCRNKMLELRQQGVTFIVVSHSKSALDLLCSRAV